MGLGLIARIAAFLVAIAFSCTVSAQAPHARAPHLPPEPPDHFTIRDPCIAYGSADTSIADFTSPRAKWDCHPTEHSIGPERVYLRFAIPEAEPNTRPLPRFLVTQLSTVRSVDIMALDDDGAHRTVHFGMNELEGARVAGFMKARLPEVLPDTRYVIVGFDLPTRSMVVERAHLAPRSPGEHPAGQARMLLMAAICGMLVMPLIFSIAYYRVLRESFIIWHAALALSLFATVVIYSGLWIYLFDWPLDVVGGLVTLIPKISIALAGMFACHFIEPGKMHPLVRRLLPIVSGVTLTFAVLNFLFPFALREQQTNLYLAIYLPVLAVYLVAIIDPLTRGSRAAWFQLAGWIPLFAVGAIRIVTQSIAWIPDTDAMDLFLFGIVCEAMAAALGVADRFMSIKQDRDRARNEALVMGEKLERDPLTGLMNRRVIEQRFAKLRADGFTTMAVLDLDHFKGINDRFGHAVGDDVLKALSKALSPDNNTLAIRMGGEEFLLLLKGRDSFNRAEQRRQAIPARVAAMVEGLDRPVTASMGMVEMPMDAAPDATFAQLYERADKMLYEAKEAGRNRTVSERVKLFMPRRKNRRRRAAA